MDTTQETATTRERKTTYYLTTSPVVFRNKREVEEYLTQHGGLKDGQKLLKGVPVEAKQESVFSIQ